VIELLYDVKALPLVKERFPHVKVTDASDSIHEDRVELELPDEDKEALYKDAMVNGYYTVLLGFQLMMTIPGEDQETLKRWAVEVKGQEGG